MPTTYETAKPVSVTFEQLQNGVYVQARDMYLLADELLGSIDHSTLVEAFGPDSLGIIVVTGLPVKFAPLRKRILSFASHLGNLSPQELKGLEHPEAKYLVGW